MPSYNKLFLMAFFKDWTNSVKFADMAPATLTVSSSGATATCWANVRRVVQTTDGTPAVLIRTDCSQILPGTLWISVG